MRYVLWLFVGVCVVACSAEPVEAPSTPPLKRVSKLDASTLLARIGRIEKKACDCKDVACADRSLSHLYAFARRFSGVQLATEASSKLVSAADRIIACTEHHLSTGVAPTVEHQ